MSPKKEETLREQYVAICGLNYPSVDDGKERRREPGEVFDDMPPTSIRHEHEAGNIKTLAEVEAEAAEAEEEVKPEQEEVEGGEDE